MIQKHFMQSLATPEANVLRHAAQITSHDPLYARVNAKLKMSATRFLSDFFFFFLDVSLQMKQ